MGGRLVVTSTGEWLLSDAFASLPIVLRKEVPGVESGDLAVIEGIVDDGGGTRRVIDAAIERSRSPVRRSSNEVARLRDGGIGHSLALRARATAAIRAYFDGERFVEVETPCLVPSPGLDRHLDAFATVGDLPERFLITSPEYQMKRLLTGGIPRCFQIARCFRRAEVGGHHNPEFTMLEWYRAFVGMDAILRDTEEIVRAVVRAIAEKGTLTVGKTRVDVESPFERITVAKAFRDLAGVDEEAMLHLAVDDEEEFFRILIDKIEPILRERTIPVVLHRYPAKMASLATLATDDPRYAERFEVYIAGLELSNGFVELTDPDEQRMRLERDQRERREHGQPVYPIDERFLAALEEGLPDCAGNALGLDRLIMLASGRTRIGDVLAFPEGHL